MTSVAIDAAHQNLWRRTQLESSAYAFIVWDYTDHYPQIPGRQPGEPVVIAKWTKSASWGGAFALVGHHTWPESECTPANLIGQTPPLAGRPQQAAFWSTLRVIRAVSEAEFQGVLDGMNAYDSAILSAGRCTYVGLAKRGRRGPQRRPRELRDLPGECPSLSFLRGAARRVPRLLRLLRPRAAGEVAGPAGGDVLLGPSQVPRLGAAPGRRGGNFADTRKVTPETVAAGGPLQSKPRRLPSSSRSSITGIGSTAGRWRRGSCAGLREG